MFVWYVRLVPALNPNGNEGNGSRYNRKGHAKGSTEWRDITDGG